MFNLDQELKSVRNVAIAGHIRPDGDALGSCLGLYHYIKENFEHINVKVYLEKLPAAYACIPGVEDVCHEFTTEQELDLFFCLDCGDIGRLGDAASIYKCAKRTICIDHHVSNTGFADLDYIDPEASSTSELLCRLIDEDKLSYNSATALYFGIVHDTGVFRHSCTSPSTMEMAAKLMRKGVDCSKIINQTYYDKTYLQNQILGRALLESIQLMNGKIIFSAVKMKEMKFYGVTPSDLDGIVQILMGTTGTEAAIFLYEISPQTYKVSLRSREVIDVSKIAAYFGGGGHVRAAGCTMQGTVYDVVNNLTCHMEQQLKEAGQIGTEVMNN